MPLTFRQEWITKFTQEQAARLSKKPVTVKFKNVKSYRGETFHDKRKIIYDVSTVEELSYASLRQLAIHEVCHLRHDNHSTRFHNLCRKMGIRDDYWVTGSPHFSQRPANFKEYP